MPTNKTVALTERERVIIEEARVQLGLESMEETIEFLYRQRLKNKLFSLAGREIVKKKRSL
ncbi:hypothetical protein GCM10025882_15560 [Acinetobacter gyllenbergii]|uniref:Uncharacterized protein n=2 Tax=Acinetobacter TaxID=469 RepID=A0A558FD62_9GAMM|nr:MULTISPECIES: hypothetical protein [Acinetobacter]EPF77267.1 hypothetical protein F957_02745 [Acinetobacter gyllenbergii CIP 110306 = MTCC 11365]TVT83445.1 hypothetical protein FPV60_07760 [Acinetobacter colistiniresistens]GMA11131.1 hypothetical protein GCM10025882_15560 [Acinetobacter gyllenbergii]